MGPSMTAATNLVPSADAAMVCQEALGEAAGVQSSAPAGVAPTDRRDAVVQVNNPSFDFMIISQRGVRQLAILNNYGEILASIMWRIFGYWSLNQTALLPPRLSRA